MLPFLFFYFLCLQFCGPQTERTRNCDRNSGFGPTSNSTCEKPFSRQSKTYKNSGLRAVSRPKSGEHPKTQSKSKQWLGADTPERARGPELRLQKCTRKKAFFTSPKNGDEHQKTPKARNTLRCKREQPKTLQMEKTAQKNQFLTSKTPKSGQDFNTTA